MARSGRPPACLFHRAVSQRPLEALLHHARLRCADARRDQGRQALQRPRRPDLGATGSHRPARRARATVAPRRMRLVPGILVAILSVAPFGYATAADPKRGEILLSRDCGRCHAVGRTGPSADKDAPPFRTLGKRYPVEDLEESLGEGTL